MSSTSLTQISNHPRPNDQDSMRPFQDGRPRPSKVESQGLTVLQLNVEGLTTAKLSVLEHVATTNKATVVLLQETHNCPVSRLLAIPRASTTALHPL